MGGLLASQWDLFRTTVIPHDASPVQLQEMRRAFYAGCASLFDIQMQMTAPGKTEEDGMDVMSRIQEELMQFGRDLQNGKR